MPRPGRREQLGRRKFRGIKLTVSVLDASPEYLLLHLPSQQGKQQAMSSSLEPQPGYQCFSIGGADSLQHLALKKCINVGAGEMAQHLRTEELV